MKLIFKGKIKYDDFGEDFNCLYIDDEPLLYTILEELDMGWDEDVCFKSHYNFLVSDKPINDIEIAKANYCAQLDGFTEIEYGNCYSSTTGYLWTNAKLEVGGHDLLEELECYIDKYIYLEFIMIENRR